MFGATPAGEFAKGTLLPKKRSASGAIPVSAKTKAKQNNEKPWVKHQYELQDDGTFKCRTCDSSLSGKNVTRLKEHLLKSRCTWLSTDAARQVDDLEVKAKLAAMDMEAISSFGKKKGLKEPSQRSVKESFDSMTKQQQAEASELFARMVYETNVPFSWVEHDAVKQFFEHIRPAFKLPSRWQLANTLLVLVHSLVHEGVKEKIAKTEWLTVTEDGWSRTQGSSHLINFMLCAWGFSIFQDMVEATVDKVTAEYQLQKTTEFLQKHELTARLAAVVTDTPAVNQKYWRLLQEWAPTSPAKYILTLPCLDHKLNLFLTDVGDLPHVKETVKVAKTIVNHVNRSTLCKALFNQKRVANDIKQELEAEAQTRFATIVRVLYSLIKNKAPLQEAVVLVDWPTTAAAKEVRDFVLDEDNWINFNWLHSTYCLTAYQFRLYSNSFHSFAEVLTPVADAIHELETAECNLADAYFKMLHIDGIVKLRKEFDDTGMDCDLFDELDEHLAPLWEHRKEYCASDAYALAALLDPRYREMSELVSPDDR
jgi:hypothetical protein